MVSEPKAAAVTDRAGPQHNVVLLVGRVSGEPELRVLRSGTSMLGWRLVVDRPPDRSRPVDRPGAVVDTIDCVAFARGIVRLVGRWRPGDVVEIRRALRRRFWRPAGGPASRCEVEVVEARRLAKAPG